jgi:hypothetical protein
MSPDCPPCVDAFPFYERLLSLPNMDGIHKRLVVLTQGGVLPVNRVLAAHGFVPHLSTSGPAAVLAVSPLPTTAPVIASERGPAH